MLRFSDGNFVAMASRSSSICFLIVLVHFRASRSPQDGSMWPGRHICRGQPEAVPEARAGGGLVAGGAGDPS